ncbi:MAG: hypothetical protein LBC09_06780, partial [Helicobacteraceae bacterium]|nr:hypothetical protein [Helicobacteraceae bacterium]
MGKIRFRFNPFSLGAIALICAAIFGYLACEALRSQYFERSAGKSYFIDNKDFHPSQLDDQGLRMVIKANKIFSFRKDGEFHFGVYKYRQTASASPDGVIATIYADGEPIALALRNPYADKSAPYIDDGFADIVNMTFNIPKAAKEIVVEFSQNINSDLDIVEPVKLKIHKANALGCAIAVIALLGFIASLIGLIYFALKRYSSAAFAVDLRAYFNNEKTALLIYRAAIAVLIICAAYGIMVSAGFTFNQEGRFHIPISLDDFFLYHAPRSDGRFFPLANTDYNLLWFLPYGFSAQGFYFINLITFIATIWAMVYLIAQSDRDKTTSRYINAFLLIVILLSLNRSIRAFMEIIYPERLLAITIVAFMIVYKKALDSDKIAWFAVALLTAVYATYQKELVFGIFVVFAVFSLLFIPKTKKQTLFNIALIINGAVFLLIYYFTTIVIMEHSYGSDRASYEPSEYAAFFAQNWLIIILFVFSAIRGWYLIAKKDRSRLFYDA